MDLFLQDYVLRLFKIFTSESLHNSSFKQCVGDGHDLTTTLAAAYRPHKWKNGNFGATYQLIGTHIDFASFQSANQKSD